MTGKRKRDYKRELNLGADDRDKYGVIVTAREQTTGELWTLHAANTPTRALAAVVEEIDAAQGHWLIVSISTPPSVFRDVRGDRGPTGEEFTSSFADPRLTELSLLRRLGRTELLQPLTGTPYLDSRRTERVRRAA